MDQSGSGGESLKLINHDMYLVGIGASDQCIDHLETFVKELPVETGISYVLLQPFLQNHKSIMIDLLGKFSAKRVVTIEDGVEIKPDHFYLVQPDETPTIEGNRFKVLPDTENKETLHPIDYFFRSLAENFGEKAISILFSEDTCNGTQGCNAIKANGGMIMVNESSCAAMQELPCSISAKGHVDYVLAPQEMPLYLIQYVEERKGFQGAVDESDKKRGVNWFTRIIEILLDHEGIDFSRYKTQFLERKIERRISMCHCKNMEEYVAFLLSNEDEIASLRDDFLMSTTRFFRDYGAFDYIESEILPKIFNSKSEKDPIRVWVIGCSTGEEAYSFGLLLLEAMQENERDVLLYATDLDTKALDEARKGTYPEGIIADVDEDYLLTYFQDADGCFEVGEELRNLVIFQKHNVLTQKPIQEIDLIACRYLMRALKNVTQQELLEKLHGSLKPNGYLVLGSGENAGEEGDLFETVDPSWKVYRPVPQDKPVEEQPVEAPQEFFRFPGMEVIDRPLLEAILRETNPASILVEHDGRMVCAYNGGEKYLGKPNNGDPPYLHNIIDISLRDSLCSMINGCDKEGRKLHHSIEHNNTLLRMTCFPLAVASQEHPFYLITFKETITR